MESISDTPSLLFGCLKLIKFLNISGFLDELPHFSCALGLETEISSLVCLRLNFIGALSEYEGFKRGCHCRVDPPPRFGITLTGNGNIIFKLTISQIRR